jgi:hypothetical protein
MKEKVERQLKRIEEEKWTSNINGTIT